MKTYKLEGTVTVSIYTEVEAESLEKAIEISQDRDIQKSEWNGDAQKYAWVNDDYDGEPQNIKEL